MAGAIYTSLTLSRADIAYRENTVDSLRRAAQLNPRSGAIPLALGIQLDLTGGDPESALRAAAGLSPYLAEPRMRLGLLAEARGDRQSAERHLLHAADLERLRQPRAVLMSFYSRHGDAASFWRWARLTFERGYGDLTPFFNLCWQMAADPDEVYAKAIPRDLFVQRSYVAYLLSKGALAALAEPVRDLLAVATPQDAGVLLQYCDRLIESSPAEAVAVWNAACLRRVIQSDPIDPQGPPSLVNATFRHPPLQHGFDWRVPQNGEMTTALLPDGGMEFSFTGRQAQGVLLLSQLTPVGVGSRGRLAVEYYTERMSNPSGLHCEVEERGGGILSSTVLPVSETLRTETIQFVGGKSGLVNMRFRYERPLGSVRTEGTVVIRSVRLEAAQ